MSDDDIVHFYTEQYNEEERLDRGANRVELLRTQQLIGRHLGADPMKIADIGGGPGVYAQWLAQLGHDVVLVDPVARHVEAAAALDAGRGSIEARLGDARQLELADNSFDAALMLGPLYHLIDAGDRQRALAEAFRVVRPGGVLFVAVITRFASFHDGLKYGWIFESESHSVAESIDTGVHQNPERIEGRFTNAYFHLPGEFAAELAEAGLVDVTIEGLEGASWIYPDIEHHLDDPDRRAVLLDYLDRLGSEPSLLGISSHLLATAHRPT